MIIFDQPDRVGHYVSRLISGSKWHDFSAIGIERSGALVGGAVIDNYVEGARCALHCAGDGKNWMTRSFIKAVFRYIFIQLKCKVIISPVESENEKAIKFISHIGFKDAYRIKNGGSNGQDLIIFEMQIENCKYI
jgi:RimJ/RimL family protein N-acetyltransferase